MSNLTKGMYADYVCNVFGLTHNQLRADALIFNAGWFNSKGEKLGQGDLNAKDLQNISFDIETNEVFIALSEADTTWNLPSDLDRNAPGIDYVMSCARWIISGIEETIGEIYHCKANASPTTVIKDNITYTEASRQNIYSTLSFVGGQFTSIKVSPTASSIISNNYYGLDEYHLTDGSSWAVGPWNKIQDACLEKAAEQMSDWLLDLTLFGKLVPDLSLSEREMIHYMISGYGSGCQPILNKLLSDASKRAVCKHIFASLGAPAILAIDRQEYWSQDIKGLPRNLYAYRIA